MTSEIMANTVSGNGSLHDLSSTKSSGIHSRIIFTWIFKIFLKSHPHPPVDNELTHWGWVTHTCFGKLTITGSDNGLSPNRRQTIIGTNAGILLSLRNKLHWNLNQNSYFFIQENAFKNVVWKWPFCFGLNVLKAVERSSPGYCTLKPNSCYFNDSLINGYPKLVILTTFWGASDEDFIKITVSVGAITWSHFMAKQND